MYQIVRREVFSDTTFLWDISAPDVARSAHPGHFVMLRLHDGSERIPLTVADYDRERGTITMVIQSLGKTTLEMRDRYAEGDIFDDFVGPLGQPQHIENVGHVVLVGGGLGVAPVYPQLRAFKQAGNRTTGIIGFRNKDLVFWEDKFARYCDDLIVCTDDGSYGKPGFVTTALKELLETDPPDLVVAIGPLPMMNACVETTRPFGVKTMVSLNAIMVDGTGMCGSCRVNVGGEVKFACVDGPDFDGHLVDFKELIARQRRFKSQESTANEAYAHICNVEKQLFEDGKRGYKKLVELAPHQVSMPERDALERVAQLQGGEPRLLDARCLRRGRALHPVQEADLHLRLPGVDRHPPLHPPPAGARPRWRARRDLRVQPLPLDLRPRLPAGIAVREPVRHQQEDGDGGDRPAGALRRRQRPAAQGGAAALRRSRWAASPSSARARPGWRPRPICCATAPRSPSTRRCT